MAEHSTDKDYILLDLTIDNDEYKSGAALVVEAVKPRWDKSQLNFHIFTGGITNKIVGVYTDDFNDMILLRIFGEKTEEFVDREGELRIMLLLHRNGLCPAVYAKFNNGICCGFAPGQCVTKDSVRLEPVNKLIAATLARLHCVEEGENIKKETNVFKFGEAWIQLVPDNFLDPANNEKYHRCIPRKHILAQELAELAEELTKLESPVVLCHNDLLLNNIVYDKDKGTVTFIDYEYAGYNNQAFDIAVHFIEYAGLEEMDFSLYPDKDYQMEWLKEYLTHWQQLQQAKDQISPSTVTQQDVEKLYFQTNKFVPLTLFFTGLWGLLQVEKSLIDFDFLQYSVDRFREYFRRKGQLL